MRSPDLKETDWRTDLRLNFSRAVARIVVRFTKGRALGIRCGSQPRRFKNTTIHSYPSFSCFVFGIARDS
jgi:hypothetical protein